MLKETPEIRVFERFENTRDLCWTSSDRRLSVGPPNSRFSMKDAVSDYLQSIGRIPLLTADEEILLGNRVRRWKDWEGEPPAHVVRSGKKAHDRMVSANLRLVVSLAKKYTYRGHEYGLDFMDLVQEGSIGLARSVDKFDPARGYKFSTYAYWWTMQSITRAMQTSTSTKHAIRVPINARETYNKAARLSLEYEQHNGEKPSIPLLAGMMDVKPERLTETLKLVNQAKTISTDSKFLEDGTSLIDMIADPNSTVEVNLDHELAYQALSKLPDEIQEIVERAVIKEESMVQIGKESGVSRENIRIKKQRGLNKMRHMMRMQSVA